MPSEASYASIELRSLPPMFSGLGRVHASLRPIGYPVMRIVVGLAFVPAGWPKLSLLLSGHAAGLAKVFATHGYVPGMFWLTVVGIVEFFGGLMLAAGLLTRLAAVAVGIDLLLAWLTVVVPRSGFDQQSQLLLLWGLMVFGIGCIGGGRYSVDAVIGKEL